MLIPSKQTPRFARQIGTSVGMVQPKQIRADAPSLAVQNASDRTAGTGTNVEKDTLFFAVTTPDATDHHQTTGVDIYDGGSLVGPIYQNADGTANWAGFFHQIASGAKNYKARRKFSDGSPSVDSAVVPVTVTAANDATGVSGATLKAYYRGDNFTLGGTPLAAGTTPPAVTLTGTLTTQTVDFYMTITVGGARGTATYSVSITGPGGTIVQTGTTAATVVLTGTGLTINFPTGTYNVNNTYRGVVSVFVDKSGNANDASNFTAGLRPFLIAAANGQGGQIGAKLDGVNDRLDCATGLAAAVVGGTNAPFSALVFFNLRSLPATGTFLNFGNTGAGQLQHISVQIDAGLWRLVRRDNSGNVVTLTSTVPCVGGLHLLALRFDGTNVTLTDNGADVIGGLIGQETSGAWSTPAALTLNNMTLGADNFNNGVNLGNWTPIDFYEFTLFSGALSDVELAKYMAYF